MELIYMGKQVETMIGNKIAELKQQLKDLEASVKAEQEYNNEKEANYLNELETYEGLPFFKKVFGTPPMPIYRIRLYQNAYEKKMEEMQKWTDELAKIHEMSYYRFTEMEVQRLSAQKVS